MKGGENMEQNELLIYFGVNSHQELQQYIADNPEDPKVQELQAFLTYQAEQDESKQ